MAIPDFQSLMLPALKFMSSKEEKSTKEVVEHLVKEYKLTEAEIEELLPSRTQSRFTNRVYWAVSYLKMAGLIEKTRKGYYLITDNGVALLHRNPPIINLQLIKTIPAFIEHINSTKKERSNNLEDNESDSTEDTQTPEENMEDSFQKINDTLAQELLSKVKNVKPAFFERLVIELLVKMGYGGSMADAGKAIGKSGDEGIDGIIKEDKLGLDIIYVQAKRWQGVVGRPELQKFVGALAGQGAKKGVFITTSYFSKEALDYAPRNETKIVLVDGEQLAKLMIENDLAVSTVSNYLIKKIDTDYFEEE
ncbi:restriction endonuclease [bacterium BRH_c32]|nr:MAG: restriction endonuclease [bacterium BRH_c32]